jgi:hypothetical protein
MNKNYIILTLALIFTLTAYGQNKLDSTVTFDYSNGTPAVRNYKTYFDSYNTAESLPLHSYKYYWNPSWVNYAEENYIYNSNDNLLSYEFYKSKIDSNKAKAIDTKVIYNYNANNKITEKLIYKNRFEGFEMTREWEKSKKEIYYYSANNLDSIERYGSLNYWQGFEKVKYTYDGSNNLITQNTYNWYPEEPVRVYNYGMYAQNPQGTQNYIFVAYNVIANTDINYLSNYTLDSNVEFINVYTNNGSNDIRYDLSGVAGKTLKAVFQGDNNSGQIIDINQLRHDYREWFKIISNDNITSVKCNIKAGIAFDVNDLVDVKSGLFKETSDGDYAYENTTYLVKGAASLDDLSNFTFPSDIQWVSVYLQKADSADAPIEALSFKGYAGQTLKQLFVNENIDLDDLTQEYKEMFTDSNSNNRLVRFNVIAIKETTPNSNVQVFPKLLSSGDSHDYVSTAYNISAGATLSTLSNYTIASNIDFINVYTNDGTSNIRYDLHGVANKTLDSIFQGSNNENQIININELRNDYKEWFFNVDGDRVLVQLNVKATNDLGVVPFVVTTDSLLNYGSSDYNNTAYYLHSTTHSDLKFDTVSQYANFLDVYAFNALGLRVKYSLHSVAGKTLSAILLGDNAENKVVDLTKLRPNYFEWFKDFDGKTRLVKIQLKAVEIMAQSPVVVTDSVYTKSNETDNIFENTIYYIKSFASIGELMNFTLASNIDYLNVYTTDASGMKSLHGVAGKTLKAVFEGDNTDSITIDINSLKSNYKEWFYNNDGELKLYRLNVKAVNFKTTGLDNLKNKVEFTYAAGKKATKIVSNYDEAEQIIGDYEKTNYTFNGQNLTEEEVFTGSGSNWTEKEKFEYNYLLNKVLSETYFKYNGSSYDKLYKKHYYYYNTIDIETVVKQLDLEIYPNPVNNNININVANINSFDYSIYNITGKIIKQGHSGNSSIKIDVSDMNRGVYILRIMNEEKSSIYKFIKQ